MDEKTIREVDETIKNRIFRNKSHLIELATEKFLEELKNNNSTKILNGEKDAR